MDDEILELVVRLKDGDMSAFDKFYELTKKTVFYNIYSVTQNHMVSEDILQDVYIKFLETLKKVKTNVSPLGYMMKISKNMAIDYVRKYKKELHFDQYENEEVYGFTEDKIDYSDHLILEMKKILSDFELKVVLMRVLQDMTHKEIAESLNKPIGTITWTYNQAIKKLKEGLNYELN